MSDVPLNIKPVVGDRASLLTDQMADYPISDATSDALGDKSGDSHDHDSDYLNVVNTDAFTPSADYHPATKKYVDDNGGGGGSGDVVGPGSAVDDNLASFDTTTGKLVQDSGLTTAEVEANTSARHAASHTVASHSDTTATGSELDELTDGSETTLHSHAAAGGSSPYMYPVWAEENSTLGATTYEWAYGNGANTPSDGGVTIYVPSGYTCTVVALSLRLGGGTATVELLHNGTLKGSDANVVLSTGQSATNELSTPLAISNNDYINFRTTAASSTASPCVVTAWLKMTPT